MSTGKSRDDSKVVESEKFVTSVQNREARLLRIENSLPHSTILR